jgi:membrane-associated protein
MCCCIQVSARQSVTLRFTNQYESPVKEVTIMNGGNTNTYQASDSGTVTIEFDPSQTVTVSAKEHKQQVLDIAAPAEALDVVLQKQFTWKDILNPVFYIIYGGLWMILFIIFAETGLFIGFFLPGDSLLFVAGIYSEELSNALYPGTPFFFIMVLVSLAGVLGNMTGYWFGRKSGPYLFQRKDTFFFKKKHLFTAKEFYDKNGAGAIIIARFLPIVRTFAPIVAGIVKMDRKKFMIYNIIGCLAWVFSMMLAGHYLNKIFPSLKHRLELIVIVIILITTLPVLYKFFFKKNKKEIQAEV